MEIKDVCFSVAVVLDSVSGLEPCQGSAVCSDDFKDCTDDGFSIDVATAEGADSVVGVVPPEILRKHFATLEAFCFGHEGGVHGATVA
jgi:hypothetical protein